MEYTDPIDQTNRIHSFLLIFHIEKISFLGQ
jgi:hypothetical protein